MGTVWGTGFGIGVEENTGRLGSPVGWEGGVAGVGALNGAGVGTKGAGGGDVISDPFKRSPRVVAERGAMTFGAKVEADMGVGVENRLTSNTRAVLIGICLGEVNELPTIVVV